MPLQRRLPKRGFRPILKKPMSIIHLKDLNRFESGSTVDPDLLLRSGLLRKKGEGVKLLSDGEIEHPLIIRVHQASKAAIQKVEAVSGKVEVMGS